jgi:hypoxanthine phosphoribosyltransferase
MWVEREGGEFRLRRFEIEPGARVVIVEDIVTTGLSIRETIACLTALGAEVVAAPASSTARPARPMSACRWWRSPSMRCRPIHADRCRRNSPPCRR